MRDLRRVHPPDKEVLRGINISMYPGAKIGVLGPQRRRQVDAAADHRRRGRRLPGRVPGHAGLLASASCRRSRSSTRRRTCSATSPTVSRDTKDLLDRFEEVCNAMGEPDADFDKLLAEQSELQDKIDARQRLGPRPPARDRDGRAAPPAGRRRRHRSSRGGERRRVALCRLLLGKPDLLLLDEPTNHLDAESVAWLERHLQEYHGTVVAVTHDRYFLDNVAGWILELDRGAGIPWEGNYSSWLEQKEQRLAQEEKVDETRRRTLQRELEWVRMAPRARQAKGKARINAYDKLVAEAESAEARQDEAADLDPARPAPRRPRRRGRAPAQGLRRPAADRRPLVLAAAGRHRRRDRRQRRGQDHAVPHARRPGAARRRFARRSARRSSSRTSTSRASRSTPTRPSTRRSPAASTS